MLPYNGKAANFYVKIADRFASRTTFYMQTSWVGENPRTRVNRSIHWK